MLDRCAFTTERFEVTPWHDAADPSELADIVVSLLSPAVTASLPPDWAGAYDGRRATAWIADRDRESAVSLVRTADGRAVGLVVVGRDGDEARLGFLIAEQHWGQGIATEIVGGFVEWCAGRFATVRAGVAVGNEASARVLKKVGFVADGGAGTGEQQFHLDPPAVIVVRPERPGDHIEIRRVVAAAFGSAVESDLVERIRASPEYVPELALVAEVGGAVVGHVMISGAVVRSESGDHRVAMLSPLAVAPDHQRLGIGGRLVEAVLRAADAQGEPVVVLEGDPRYYRRFGFEPARALGLVLPLPDWAPSDAGQLRRLGTYRPDDDRLRGVVVYPPAFDGLD